MLLDDDVVADGKAKAGSFSCRLSREEGVEDLFFHVRRDAGAVVANSNFHTIAKVFGRGRRSRFVFATVSLCYAPGRSIETVCNQIKESPPDVLRENVCPTGRWIKGLLELDLKTLRLGPRSMPCEIAESRHSTEPAECPQGPKCSHKVYGAVSVTSHASCIALSLSSTY